MPPSLALACVIPGHTASVGLLTFVPCFRRPTTFSALLIWALVKFRARSARHMPLFLVWSFFCVLWVAVQHEPAITVLPCMPAHSAAGKHLMPLLLLPNKFCLCVGVHESSWEARTNNLDFFGFYQKPDVVPSILLPLSTLRGRETFCLMAPSS